MPNSTIHNMWNWFSIAIAFNLPSIFLFSSWLNKPQNVFVKGQFCLIRYMCMCKCVLCVCLLIEGECECSARWEVCVWFQSFMFVCEGVCTVVQFWPRGHFERLCPEWGLSSTSLCFDSSLSAALSHTRTLLSGHATAIYTCRVWSSIKHF